VRLLGRPRWHGRTFHLVARRPVLLREIKVVVEDLLHLEGVEWAGGDGLEEPTSLEQLVLEQFRDYWAYLRGGLVFDGRSTRRALPDWPPPAFDRALASRLLDFAVADGWGRGAERARPAACAEPSDCAPYLEEFLPARARHSPLAQALSPGLVFAFDVQGPGGGRWSCRRQGGGLEVRRGLSAAAAVTYRTDAATFAALVRGRETPQEAFFAGRVELGGDMEAGLKLAALFSRFLAEVPYEPARRMEVPLGPVRA
jgi:hypothetical protein